MSNDHAIAQSELNFRSKEFLFFLLINFLSLVPFFSVTYFYQQDGLGHLYTSYVMKELVLNNSFFQQTFLLNSIALPNSIGHWIMAILSVFFSVTTVSKIIVVTSLVSVPVGVMILRFQTSGAKDLWHFGLLGLVISFNTLWFVGAYNFIFAMALMAGGVGLFFKWRNDMSVKRLILLVLILTLTFVGHIVSFGILSGSVICLALTTEITQRKKTIILTSIAFLLITPILLAYINIGSGGEPFYPNWRHIDDSMSVSSWVKQLISFDPFAIISRKSLPFMNVNSGLLIFTAPLLWIGIAMVLWALSTVLFSKVRAVFLNYKIVFILLSFGTLILALIGPDDFGLLNGSILRERLLLCGIILTIPLFQLDMRLTKNLGALILLSVLGYQTLAVFEFASTTDKEATSFTEASQVIEDNDSIASIIILQNSLRFHSNPTTQMINKIGFGRNVLVVDNYEIGHKLFPLIAKEKNYQQFVFDLTTSNVFYFDRSSEENTLKLNKLNKTLEMNVGKINKLIVWGNSEEVDSVLFKYFDNNSLFMNERIRVLKRKKL